MTPHEHQATAGGDRMKGRGRTPWRQFIDDLFRAPVGSVEREIAESTSGAMRFAAIVAYLDELIATNPENSRRGELAWELRYLMMLSAEVTA